MDLPRSTGVYGMFSIGVLATLVALMSSRLDRVIFYILSSGSMILALLMASAFLEGIFRLLASPAPRAREFAADDANTPVLLELEK